jgi:hypothetical protein
LRSRKLAGWFSPRQDHEQKKIARFLRATIDRWSVKIALALAVTLISFSAYGTPKKMIGEGWESCGKWTKERSLRTERSIIMATWVLGYVSGQNQAVDELPDFLLQTDAEGMLAWIDNFCRSNPLEIVGTAVDKLVLTLGTKAVEKR